MAVNYVYSYSTYSNVEPSRSPSPSVMYQGQQVFPGSEWEGAGGTYNTNSGAVAKAPVLYQRSASGATSPYNSGLMRFRYRGTNVSHYIQKRDGYTYDSDYCRMMSRMVLQDEVVRNVTITATNYDGREISGKLGEVWARIWTVDPQPTFPSGDYAYTLRGGSFTNIVDPPSFASRWVAVQFGYKLCGFFKGHRHGENTNPSSCWYWGWSFSSDEAYPATEGYRCAGAGQMYWFEGDTIDGDRFYNSCRAFVENFEDSFFNYMLKDSSGRVLDHYGGNVYESGYLGDYVNGWRVSYLGSKLSNILYNGNRVFSTLPYTITQLCAKFVRWCIAREDESGVIDSRWIDTGNSGYIRNCRFTGSPKNLAYVDGDIVSACAFYGYYKISTSTDNNSYTSSHNLSYKTPINDGRFYDYKGDYVYPTWNFRDRPTINAETQEGYYDSWEYTDSPWNWSACSINYQTVSIVGGKKVVYNPTRGFGDTSNGFWVDEDSGTGWSSCYNNNLPNKYTNGTYDVACAYWLQNYSDIFSVTNSQYCAYYGASKPLEWFQNIVFSSCAGNVGDAILWPYWLIDASFRLNYRGYNYQYW